MLAGLALAGFLAAPGCHSLIDRGAPLVPSRDRVRTGPFVIFSNSNLTPQSPAVRCLAELERDFAGKLGVAPARETGGIEIYVLDDRETFAHFLKFYYPELPSRRAFFLARGNERLVYTYAGPRLEEDLRHEAAHALLRGAYGELPLWVDEGLAEYFENDLARPAQLRQRTERLLDDMAAGWTPSLERLDTLEDVHQMTPRDYREAWAWVHLMLDGNDESRARFKRLLEEQGESHGELKLAAKLEQAGAARDAMRAHLLELQSRISAVDPAEIARQPLFPPLFGR